MHELVYSKFDQHMRMYSKQSGVDGLLTVILAMLSGIEDVIQQNNMSARLGSTLRHLRFWF